MVKVSLNTEKELHKRIRIAALDQEVTMKVLIASTLEEAFMPKKGEDKKKSKDITKINLNET